MNNLSYPPGGGAGAIPIAIRGDGTPAIFATIAARDTYYSTEPGLSELTNDLDDRNVAVGIGSISAITAAFLYRSSETPIWQPIATNFKGDPGQDGAPGSSTDFSGVGENNIPVPGAAPNYTPEDSGLRADNGILYFGNIADELTMRIRRDNTTGYLMFDRLESGTWNEKFQISDSATVDVVNFTESASAPTSVPANSLALYNKTIRDDQGNQILRPFFTDGINTFPAMASLPNGGVRVIQNLAAILADPANTNAQYKTIAFTQDLATVATSGDYGDLSNPPTIGVTVEDEGNPLATLGTVLNFVGDGVQVAGSGNRKVITIAGGGGPTPPGPGPNDFRYGRSQQSNPANVTWSGLTDVATPTDPQTVSTGTTIAGDYFHIFSANSHDIQTIRDTVLDQIVYQDGGTGNIFTKVSSARIENSITYDAYTVGPLNAGVDEEYIVRFS